MKKSYTKEEIAFILFYKAQGLTFREITKIFKTHFNEEITSGQVSGVYNRNRDITDSDNQASDIEVIQKNLKKYHSTVQKNAILNKEKKALLDYETTLDSFIETLKEIEKQIPIRLHKKVNLPKKKKLKRTVVAHLSDNHIGSNIYSETLNGVNEFNPEIAARRLAFYARNLVQYKPHHRTETELVLVFNGDNLHGVIHGTDTANVLPASLQHVVGLRIYSQFISFIAQYYGKIRIICETGNHGRFTHKLNKGRQTEEKWDSFENILYFSLQERFKEYSNIEFIITKAPYTVIDIQGHKALITHGDTVINVGNPGKSIDVKNITRQVNTIASGLNYEIDILLTGHVHKATYIVLDNGTHLIINGALCGTDEYAQSLGIMSDTAIQQIFEVTPDCVVGDMRFVRVNKGDMDKTLDQIIQVDSKIFKETI